MKESVLYEFLEDKTTAVRFHAGLLCTMEEWDPESSFYANEDAERRECQP